MQGRILILSPHVDDGELGCGGTIAKLVEKGEEVHYLALSAAEASIPPGFPNNTLRRELRNAMKVLHIPQQNVQVLDFAVRQFPQHRQELLDTLIAVRQDISPDTVFTPSLKDLHQDHHVTTQEALRAFKKTASTILGYEEPWNCVTFDTTLFVVLNKRHVNRKVAALQCYETQKTREYLNPQFIRSLARARGVPVGEDYAEAFEVMRWVHR
jgi:LmbE family N-acetylglucosaminyl deacetylase